MKSEGIKGMDRAVALFLLEPSSRTALAMARQARSLSLDNGKDTPCSTAALDLYRDAVSLHDAVLTLESDPEIVKRNTLARIISGVFPVINAVEEIREATTGNLWQLLLNVLSIAAEISTATQYLEGSKLTAGANFERALVRLEDRMVSLLADEEPEKGERAKDIQSMFDGIRSKDLPASQKPMVPFMFWLLICLISYKRLKDKAGS